MKLLISQTNQPSHRQPLPLRETKMTLIIDRGNNNQRWLAFISNTEWQEYVSSVPEARQKANNAGYYPTSYRFSAEPSYPNLQAFHYNNK